MIEFFNDFPEIIARISSRKDGNMKFGDGDMGEVSENRKIFFKKNNISENKIVSAKLAHGNRVELVNDKSPRIITGADALVTRDKNKFLSITVADCYPVLFYDPIAEIIAIAHAGWKGVSEDIIFNIVSKMIESGSNNQDIIAEIGPGICLQHFEFDKDQAKKEFNKYYLNKYSTIISDEKVRIDLRRIIVDQLEKNGIIKIKGGEECTYCDQDKYFSARRDKKSPVEAMIVVIGMKK